MVKPTAQSVFWTKVALILLAAVIGAVAAHAIQLLVVGGVSVAVNAGAGAAAAVVSWMRLNRRYGGFRGGA
jgi:hypothetical protein